MAAAQPATNILPINGNPLNPSQITGYQVVAVPGQSTTLTGDNAVNYLAQFLENDASQQFGGQIVREEMVGVDRNGEELLTNLRHFQERGHRHRLRRPVHRWIVTNRTFDEQRHIANLSPRRGCAKSRRRRAHPRLSLPLPLSHSSTHAATSRSQNPRATPQPSLVRPR